MKKKSQHLKNKQLAKPPHELSSDKSVVSATHIRTWPIPDSNELKAYDKIVPGAAERIISMAHSQINHRHKMEEMIAREQLRHSARGQ